MDTNCSTEIAEHPFSSPRYDLLGGGSKTFSAVYDLFKPRPHFIISAKGGQSWSAFDAKDPKFMEELVDVACVIGDHFTSPVLSIHRGSCVENGGSFSARVCVGKEEYIQHYDSHKNIIPNWPPNKSPPSEHWVASHSPNNYALNVRGYPYNDQRLADIKDIAQCDCCFELTNTYRNRNNWKVVFHPYDSRIGVVRIGPAQSDWKKEVLEVLTAMDELAEENFEGYHLCVSLAGLAFAFGGVEGAGNDVIAYLQVSALEFYQCCSDSWQWFERYLEHPRQVPT